MPKASELKVSDIGRTITVKTGDATVTGTLCAIDAIASLVSDQGLTEPEPRWILGYTSLRLTVIPDTRVTVRLGDDVQLA